jgi:hypothetical protein
MLEECFDLEEHIELLFGLYIMGVVYHRRICMAVFFGRKIEVCMYAYGVGDFVDTSYPVLQIQDFKFHRLKALTHVNFPVPWGISTIMKGPRNACNPSKKCKAAKP